MHKKEGCGGPLRAVATLIKGEAESQGSKLLASGW